MNTGRTAPFRWSDPVPPGPGSGRTAPGNEEFS